MDRAAAALDLKIADDVNTGEARFWGFHYNFQGPCPTSDGQCDLDAPIQVSVPGLTCDLTAKKVVYEGAGAEPVTCASARSGGLLNLGESLVPTGNCSSRLVEVDRPVDDGFAGRRERRNEVHFTVKSP